MAFEDPGAPGGAQFRAEGWIVGKGCEGLGEGGGVADGDDDSGAVGDEARNPRAIGGEDGKGRGHCFQGGEAKRFVVAGNDADVGGGIDGRQVAVRSFAQKEDLGGKAQVGDLVADGVFQGAAAGQEEARRGPIPSEAGEGIDEHGVVFESLEAGDVYGDEVAGGDAELIPQRGRLRAEEVRIDGIGHVDGGEALGFEGFDAGSAGDEGVGAADAAARVVKIRGGEAEDEGKSNAALLCPEDEVGQFADLDDVETFCVPPEPVCGAQLEPFEFEDAEAPTALDFIPREMLEPRGMQDGSAVDGQRRRREEGRAGEEGDLGAAEGEVARNLEIEGFAAAAFDAGHSVDEQDSQVAIHGTGEEEAGAGAESRSRKASKTAWPTREARRAEPLLEVWTWS